MLVPLLKGFGMMPAIAQVYLVEVVEEKNRNLLGTSFAVSISIGITLVYVSGYVMKSYELVCWTFLYRCKERSVTTEYIGNQEKT